MSLLRLDRRNHILQVRLNRPDKRNALSFDLLRELRALARSLRGDRELRAVILAGEGPSFSAGIDLGELNNPRNRWFALWSLLRPGRNLFQEAFLAWQRLPVPVIAAIHGHCYGAGMQLALAADIRIATPDSELSIMEARWGLVPDMGLSQSVRGLVRSDVLKELVLSARVVSGDQAQALGLVTHVRDDPGAAALDLAQEFAQRSPDALHASKALLNAVNAQSPRRTLALEKRWQLKLLFGRNVAIARRRAKEPATPFRPRQY